METDPESAHVGTQKSTLDAPPPATWKRITASTRPSGMWFCPMPRCAQLEGASPTGWSCLQSFVPDPRSVHLSTGAAPPDTGLDTHGLRVCLAYQEFTPQGARCPGPRCSTAVLAALALGNTAPPTSTVTLATGRDSHGGPGPGAPTGNTDFHAAQGPHRGLLHVRPGAHLPAAAPGTGADM